MPQISDVYVGEVDDNGARLWYHNGDGARQDVPHVIVDSPVGLAWGFAGNGPADTARSILVAETGSAKTAELLYEAFTVDVVSKLPLNQRFALPRTQVREWLVANAPDHALAPLPRRAPAQGLDDGEPVAGELELDREAAQLATRSRALDERERQVTKREARVDALAVSVGLMPEVAQATWLPAEPVRRQLEALVIDSGDDIAEVARFTNLDPTWATAVVEGNATRVDLAHVRQVCEGMRCTPYDLWGTAGARSIAYAYVPSEWPAETEALMPVEGVELADTLELAAPATDPLPPPGGPVGPDLALEFAPDVLP